MSVQLVVRVPVKNVKCVLRASGQDAVFVRLFFECEEDSEKFKIVPFATDVDLAGAVRQVTRMGDHYGVVKTHRGFGARVIADQFEDAVRQIRTEDAAAFLGTRYEVSGLPLSCGKDAIQDLLSTWTGATPITTYRTYRSRTWLVSAPSAPLHDKVQHEEGIAYIQVAPLKNQHKKKDHSIKFIPSEKPKEEPSWLRSWSGKPRSRPAEDVSSSPMPPPKKPHSAQAESLAIPSQSAMAVEPKPQPCAPPQDWCAMIRDTIAEAVAPLSSSVTAMESRLAALDNRLVSLASEVTELQSAALNRDGNPTLRAGERGDRREISRSRGKRLWERRWADEVSRPAAGRN